MTQHLGPISVIHRVFVSFYTKLYSPISCEVFNTAPHAKRKLLYIFMSVSFFYTTLHCVQVIPTVVPNSDNGSWCYLCCGGSSLEVQRVLRPEGDFGVNVLHSKAPRKGGGDTVQNS